MKSLRKFVKSKQVVFISLVTLTAVAAISLVGFRSNSAVPVTANTYTETVSCANCHGFGSQSLDSMMVSNLTAQEQAFLMGQFHNIEAKQLPLPLPQ